MEQFRFFLLVVALKPTLMSGALTTEFTRLRLLVFLKFCLAEKKLNT
jgi:hypothetical protein